MSMGRGRLRGVIGFALHARAWRRKTTSGSPRGAASLRLFCLRFKLSVARAGRARAGLLLRHVSEFMGEQRIIVSASIPARAEEDIASESERLCLKLSRRSGCSVIGVYAYLAEILSKTGFHRSPRLRIERFAAGCRMEASFSL